MTHTPARASNLFENLSLPFGADKSDIDRHVRYARKVCHPDYLRNNPTKYTEAADVVRKIIDDTADILLNDESRKRYIALVTHTKLIPKRHGGRRTPFDLIKRLITSKIVVNPKKRKK
jgi:DnaJ-class molecular chaperone